MFKFDVKNQKTGKFMITIFLQKYITFIILTIYQKLLKKSCDAKFTKS